MAAAILVLLLLISPVDADADDDPDLATVVVRIDNLAPVPANYLEFAESRAAEVFKRIGVRLTWVDEETAFRDHVRPPFTVVVVKSMDQPLARSMLVDALGFADPSVSRAHVIYERVEELTTRSQRSAASLLGDVMAHELGHLLLPEGRHSARGIMRSGVETLARPIETFTGPQARQILTRLNEAH
jgi:hypothetical protein